MDETGFGFRAKDPFQNWKVSENGEDDLRTLELEPEMEVLDPEEITLDVATRLCACLQVDAEKVLFSDEAIELPDHPPLTHVAEFFDILVKNAEEYDIAKMPASQVKILVAGLTRYFIRASSVK